MTITVANIDIGDLPNDGTGDPLRIAFEKINENFASLEVLQPSGPNGSFQFNANGFPTGTANFSYVSSNNTIEIGASLVPVSSISIGTANTRIGNLFLSNNGLRVGNARFFESGNTLTLRETGSNSLASLNTGNVTTGNLTVTGNLIFGTTKIATVTANTSNSSANQVIAQIPEDEFNYGTFNVKSIENGSNNSQTVNITVSKLPNDANVNFVVSGTVFTGNVVTDYNVDIGFGFLRIMVSPFVNANMQHITSYNYTT